MIDFLFGLSFLVFPIALIYLLHCARVDLTKINISNFLLLNLFVFSYLGILPLFYKLDSYRVEMGVTSTETLLYLYFFSMLSLSFFVLGLICASRVIVFSGRKYVAFAEKDRLIFFIMVSTIPLFAITLYTYVFSLKSVALFIALQLVSGDAAVSRGEMSNGYEGYHWFKMINQDFLIFMLLWSYIKAYSNAHFKSIFYILLGMATFSVMLTTEKAPFIWMFAALLLVRYILTSEGTAKIRSILAFLGFSLIALTIFYATFMGMGFDRLGDAFLSIFSRLFAGSIQPAYYYLEYFSVNNYLLGSSFPNPGAILPFNHFYLTQEIMQFVKPESNIQGSMPTVFWGEAYANFGPMGIIFFSFFIAFFLKCVDNYFDVKMLSSLGLALYIWIIFHFKDLSVTGFSQYIVDDYFLSILVAYTLMRYLIFRKINDGSPSNAH